MCDVIEALGFEEKEKEGKGERGEAASDH